MRKRTLYSLLLMLALILALIAAVWLRKHAPPEVARLLPESDAIVYLNLRPLRAATHLERAPVSRSPEFQQFIDATGIDPERDLDAAAFALHRMDDPAGPNGPVAYSEVFEGRFDGERLAHYLAGMATSQEQYAGQTIYTIPVEGRRLRIAQLGYDTIAASNMPTAEQIHSMLDRHRTAALPFAGSTLLAQHYHDVPLLSLAWGVGQIGLPFNESGSIHIFGLALPLESDSTIVASVTPALSLGGSLNLKIEEIAPTDDVATSQAASLATLVTLARGFTEPLAANTANNALKQLLKTAEVTQKRNRVVVTATLSPALLANLAQGENSPPDSASGTTQPASK